TSCGERTPESGDAGEENLLTWAAVVPMLRTPRSAGQPVQGLFMRQTWASPPKAPDWSLGDDLLFGSHGRHPVSLL
ncbi:MAG: hypothetical protein ACJ713_17230, partial [Candidatus Sulfotelmatobacter sp.]